MPAYLRNGNIHFNQTRKVHPRDPIAQLGYYLPSSSSISSSSLGSLNTSQPSLPATQDQLSARSSDNSHNTFTATTNHQYKLSGPEELTMKAHGRRLNLYDGDALLNSHLPTGVIRRRRIRAQQLMLNEGDSGLSDDTRVETTWRRSFDRDLNTEPLNEINWIKRQTQSPAGVHYMMKQQQQQTEAKNQPRNPMRMKRRNMGRNRRMLVDGNDEMVDPYALSELFSQSEIPGFREIFASDSYLRKFCWILAFLIMTVLSLNEFTQLLRDYFDYPITVDVRQRDSPRLPFPSVTVCNLNVVRYSALCSPSANARLFDQMPVELREKLCGVQVEKTNATELNDINNIGLITTTSTTTTAEDSVATTNNSSDTTDDDLVEQVSSKSSTASHLSSTSTSVAGETGGSSTISPSSQVSTTTQRRTTQDGGLDLGDFVNPAQLLMERPGARRNSRESRATTVASRGRRRRSIELNDRRKERPFASGSTRIRVTPQQKNPAGERRAQPAQALSQHPTLSAPNRNVNTNIRQTVVPNLPSSFNPMIGGGNHPPTTTYGPQVVANQPPVQAFAPPSLPDDFELSEREERELQENLTNWLAVLYNRDPNLTQSLGHQFDDMILRCTMKSVNCTHQRGFENSFTPTEGNCFQYKSKTRRRYSTPPTGDNQYDDANLAGTNQGLELVLNLEKGEYISGSSQVGALVMIHHPSDTGYAASEATFVAPELTTYIGLKMVNITRLEAPYPEYCVDTWPKKFADKQTRGSTYSQQSCLKICLQKTIHSHCLCQSATLPTLDMDTDTADSSTGPVQNDSAPTTTQSGHRQKIIICDTRKLLTRQCVKEVMARAADRVHNCECPPKCRVIRYDKTISMARWPTREDKVSFDRGKMDVNFQNLAKVVVYFQTMTCEETVQKAVFDKTKLFSAIGGIMGMYVGFSFLSIFEIFEVMSRKTWHHFRVKWSANSEPEMPEDKPRFKTSSPRQMVEHARLTPTKRAKSHGKRLTRQ